MFGGDRQGGGGSEFVGLTGLFKSKSGKSLVGSIGPDAFNTLFQVMKECNDKGVELVFIVSGPGQNQGENSRVAGRLSVVVGSPRPEGRGQRGGPAAGPFGGSPARTTEPVSAAPAKSAAGGNPFAAGVGAKANNPPKDELESFLEGFGN